MSSIEQSQTLEEHKSKQLCESCFLDNQEIEATAWCTFCTEPLCEKCTSDHKRLKKKAHTLVPIKEMTKQQLTELLPERDEPCLKHPGKMYEVYCVDHKELCCVICLATQHRKCEHISTFEEMINLPENIKSLEHFTACLEEMGKKASGLLTETEENLDRLQNRHSEISEQVSSSIKQMHKTLDMMHSSFQEKFQHIHKEQNGQLKARKEQISGLLNHIREGKKLLDAVREQGSAKQLFITQKKLKAQLMDQKESLKGDLKGASFVDYTFEMNDITIPVTPRSPSPTLAVIDVKPTDMSENMSELLDLMDSLSDIYSEYVDIAKMKMIEVETVSSEEKVFTFFRNRNEFTRCTYLSDGRSLLCNYSSKKLLVCRENGKYLFESPSLDKNPHDACCVSASEIVVSFYESNWLKKYEVTNNAFKETMTIQCKDQPRGLAVTQNRLIVGSSGRVDVLSMDGQFIKTLTTREGDCLSYVTVSPSGNVYYSDGNYVVCKTLDGNELRRYTHPELQRIFGIGLDKYENLYVCGFDSSNVCIISRDNNIKRMLIESITKPFKIGFDLKRENFFVAYGNGVKLFVSKN